MLTVNQSKESIDERIAYMIALDLQSYSVVEDFGMSQLLRK